MKKILLLTKTFFVVTLLCIGATNAWGEAGDVTTNANIDFSNAIADGKVVGTVNSITIGGDSYIDGDKWLRLKETGDCTITIPEEERAGSKDVVHIQFKKGWGNKNGMGSGFSLKDEYGELICNYTYARWGSGSNTLNIDMTGLVGAHASNAPIKARYTLFDVIIDYQARTITSTVECVDTDGKGTHKSETFYATLTNTNPIATFNTWGYNVGGNTDRADAIDDIVITTTEGDYSIDEYDYTVNWVCDEEIVKTAIRQGEADADIELLPSDDDPFWVSTKKYFYVSSDVAGKKVSSDGSTVVTITVREAENWDYTINAVDGSSNFLKVITAGSVAEGESVTITYPQNVFVSNKLYDIALNGSNPRFKRTITPTVDDYVVNLPYSNGVVNNVTYYTEAEDITGVSTGTNVNYASMDKYGYAADYKEVTTLPAGKYIAKARFDCGNSASEKHYYLKVGDDVVMDGVCTTQSLQNYTTTEEFTVASPATLYFKADGGSATGVDWFYIQKTGEIVTVSDAGYATYVSTSDLDFTSTSIEAYKVKVSSKGVATLTKVNEVPAGTPVLLYKEGGDTEDIPVIAGAAAVSDNDLVAGTGAAVATTDGDYTNMILNNVDGIGFYYANGQTVAANRAYLHIATDLAPNPENNARMAMRFAGDITGINEAKAEAKAAMDGKYFENGKIVIFKNGKKFNAAGQIVK